MLDTMMQNQAIHFNPIVKIHAPDPHRDTGRELKKFMWINRYAYAYAGPHLKGR
jgi:hypothetical protein